MILKNEANVELETIVEEGQFHISLDSPYAIIGYNLNSTEATKLLKELKDFVDSQSE